VASVDVTLAASTPLLVPLDAPATRVTLTMMAGAAETVATADGSNPTLPTSTENSTPARVLPPVVGAQIVVCPPMPGGHMAIPTIRLQSAGTPTIHVEW
jgi:hypothetical protein